MELGEVELSKGSSLLFIGDHRQAGGNVCI